MCISLIMRTTLIYIRKVGIDMAKNIETILLKFAAKTATYFGENI